nr:putative reverse transcriptase domain-containing protein [Tanacetum cinerariifolium]
MADEPISIPPDEIQVDDKLNFIEKYVEIMDREVKCLKQSRIPIVKVRWNSRSGHEFTWEREDQMQKKYPHLFPNSAPMADTTRTLSDRSLCFVLEMRNNVMPPDTYSIMATSVISISSDSSEDSMGTPAGRVILFSTIPTTIPDTTPMIAPPTTETPIVAPTIPPSPDYSHTSEVESDPSEDSALGHIPPLPAISPFLLSDDETIDSDTLDTPSSLPMTQLSLRLLLLPRDHLSYLIPPPKRVRDIGYLADVEVDPRETRVERAIPVHRIQTTEGVQREQGHRIVGVESAVTTFTERVAELERDNQRLRGTGSVESQREAHGLSSLDRKMRNTRSKASMTHEEVEELIARRVAKEIEVREVARNLETLNENEEEQEGENEGNGNGDNGGNCSTKNAPQFLKFHS